MEDEQDELRQSRLRDSSTLNPEIGITGGIPLIGTYTIYLVSRFGMMITQVHLCQHFRDSSQRHPSLCPLRKATLVASGPMHPSPFTDSIGPKALLWDCQYGRGGVWGRIGDGILHHAKAHPSRPVPKHHVCTNNSTESDSMYTQALSGRSQIHPELSKAMDEQLELSVFRRMQTHLLRSTTSSCTNQNQGGKEEK